MKTSSLFAAASVAVLLAAQVARAGESDMDTTQVRVTYADLNLASPSGMRTLRFRINQAVNQVCGGEMPPLTFETKRCESAARQDAMAQVERAVAAARGATIAVVASR